MDMDEREAVWIRGRNVSFSLQLPAGYSFDPESPCPMITHQEEEDVFILFNGLNAAQEFLDQVECNLSPEGADLLEDTAEEVAHHEARFLRQALREDGDMHLVLVVRFGNAGEGLLLRAIYPKRQPEREEELGAILRSIGDLVPGSAAPPAGMSLQERRPEPGPLAEMSVEPWTEGQAACVLGGFSLEWAEGTEITTREGRMTVLLQATCQGPTPAALEDVLSQENDARFGMRLHDLTFPTPLPEREIHFVGSQSPDGVWMCWDGLGYGVGFSGRVTLRNGWIHVEGHLGDGTGPGVPLAMHTPFPEQVVDPRHWVFTSVDEALRSGAENVFQVDLSLETALLPGELGDFEHLESLTLRLAGTEEPLGFGGLHALRSLRVYGDRLDRFPEEILALSDLQSLTLQVQLSDLPPGIARLGNLRELRLHHCGLACVPAELASLQQVTELVLSHNKLQELPASIGDMPSLVALNIRGNQFTSLPETLARIKDVKVEYRFKGLYMDTRYVTPHDHPFDPARFRAVHRPHLRAGLEAGIEQHRLRAFTGGILAEARAALCFTTHKKCARPRLGSTRFGGVPDLPVGFSLSGDGREVLDIPGATRPGSHLGLAGIPSPHGAPVVLLRGHGARRGKRSTPWSRR